MATNTPMHFSPSSQIGQHIYAKAFSIMSKHIQKEKANQPDIVFSHYQTIQTQRQIKSFVQKAIKHLEQGKPMPNPPQSLNPKLAFEIMNMLDKEFQKACVEVAKQLTIISSNLNYPDLQKALGG